ncbi:MAG: metallophosphoesterase, partial [Oscillospiraceae bacterium]|nr:metallophosphoesterase [Oscillospiraceae bacterium]
SDTHICECDERDNARKLALVNRNHDPGFVQGQATERFRESVAYAKSNNMPLIHTGDLIDYVTHLNIDIARREWPREGSLFAAGNHEFSQYIGEAFEDEPYKMISFDWVQSAFPDDLRFQSRVWGGVNFVALDNVYYHFQPDLAQRLEKEISKGLPIILACHVPFYTPDLYRLELAAMNGSYCGIMGIPEPMIRSFPPDRYEQMLQWRSDIDTLDWIKAQPSIKAVLAGHVHFFHRDNLSPTLIQFVTGLHMDGDALELTIV